MAMHEEQVDLTKVQAVDLARSVIDIPTGTRCELLTGVGTTSHVLRTTAGRRSPRICSRCWKPASQGNGSTGRDRRWEPGPCSVQRSQTPAAIPPADATPQIPAALLPSVLRGAGQSDLPPAELIARIEVPIRILAWEADPSHPVETAHSLAELMPSSQLQIARTPEEVRTWPQLLAQDVAATAAAR